MPAYTKTAEEPITVKTGTFMIFKGRKTQSGFTLVELMVGIGVSAAAMLATATSVTNSVQASKRN